MYFVKTAHVVSLFLVLRLDVLAWGEDDPNTRPIAHQELLRWHRFSYKVKSSYPYLEELPARSKIPALLDWIDRNDGDAGVGVAYTQLVALSRADFGHPQHPPGGELPAETLNYHRTWRSEAWRRWWESVGQHYEERLRTRGRRNPEAWKLLALGEAQPLPDYPVAIPDEWVFRTSYRAGDYDGIQTESLTLRRTKDGATLIRALRKSTRGGLEWEQWQPLTVEQADNFAFATAYAIDQPWLLQPMAANGHLKGRKISIYYPSFRYEFADLNGPLWWNDDPWHWHWRGGRPRGETFMRSAGAFGSVCLLLGHSFPDNISTNFSAKNSVGWRRVKMPDATVLRQLADDLVIRGEIIDTLLFAQRISDGLEALAEFGTSDQVPAILRLESDLPHRVEKVASILAQDPNGANLLGTKNRLLVAATSAKAAIQKRGRGLK